MGIRRRIMLGFFALGSLLFLAGVISYMELAKLNKTVSRVVDSGAASVAMSRSILDVIASQDRVVLEYISKDDTAAFLIGNDIAFQNLNNVTLEISSKYSASKVVDSLLSSKQAYVKSIREFSESDKVESVKWYLTVYKHNYTNLVSCVKDFMTTTQQEVVSEMSLLNAAAYRAIMQGIVAIATAVVILIVFFSLIDVYYISPVVKITKGLKNYLIMHTPFNVTVVGKDEVFFLKEYIEQLLVLLKSKKSE